MTKSSLLCLRLLGQLLEALQCFGGILLLAQALIRPAENVIRLGDVWFQCSSPANDATASA